MRQQGYIFVQALIVIAVLVALLAALAADQRAGLQVVQDRLDQRRALEAAQAGVARAMSVVAEARPQMVTLNDDWALLGSAGDEEFDLTGATFRVEIVDAGSLVNINTAPQAQLQLLPLAQDQIDALLDWREAGEQARPDGAKDAYYNGLPQPYNARLGPLLSIDELLLVRDWTAQMLYQPPNSQTAGSAPLPEDADGDLLPLAALVTVDSGVPSVQADGLPAVDLGQAGPDVNALQTLGLSPDVAQEVAAGAPYKDFAQVFALPGMTTEVMQELLDGATFTTDQRVMGKINLNTAPAAVLETLPNMTDSLADAIVSQQAVGFTRLSQMAALPGMTPARITQLADDFTVGSDTWIVHAYGRSGRVGSALEVVLRQTQGQVQVESWYQLNTVGVPGWWGWRDQPTTSRNAGGLG